MRTQSRVQPSPKCVALGEEGEGGKKERNTQKQQEEKDEGMGEHNAMQQLYPYSGLGANLVLAAIAIVGRPFPVRGDST